MERALHVNAPITENHWLVSSIGMALSIRWHPTSASDMSNPTSSHIAFEAGDIRNYELAIGPAFTVQPRIEVVGNQ